VRSLGEILSSSSLLDIYHGHPREPECVRVAVQEDDVVGGLVYRREILHLASARIPYAYLWEVSGESGPSSFRKTGEHALFDRLLADALMDLARRKVPFSFVHGELALFTRHGYVPCFYHPRASIPVKKAALLPELHRVRGVMSVDGPAIQRLMAEHRSERPLFFATGVPDFHHFVVEAPNRKVEGYFSLSVDPESTSHPTVFVPEVEVRTREAAMTVLRHCANHGSEVGLRTLHFAVGRDHPLAMACIQHGGAWHIRGPTHDASRDEEMIRIVVLAEALRAMQGELTDRLRAAGERGDDEWEFLLDMEGDRALLRWRDGRFTAHTVPDEPEDGLPVVRVPRWAMTQMLLGYRTVRDLPVSVVRSQRGRLARLFRRTWPLSLCDHDLWELALRRKDPRYAPDLLRKVRTLRFAW
jgi:hypothetical protein